MGTNDDDVTYDELSSSDNSWMYEAFYYETLDRMADLILSYGRNRVMADCTELVLMKLQELDRG
jgi:hypothetical protein